MVYFGPIALVDMLMQLAAEWNEFSRVAGVGDFETKDAENLLYPGKGSLYYADCHVQKGSQEFAAAIAALVSKDML
jgi:hypothetical protein